MTNREAIDLSDQRQYLINLGVDTGFVDLAIMLLHEAKTIDEINQLIRQGDHIDTALSAQQLIPSILRSLYKDSPQVRQDLQTRLAKYAFPEEILNTYFQAQQYGWIDVMFNHKEVLEKLDKPDDELDAFIVDALQAEVDCLRSYLGFSAAR